MKSISGKRLCAILEIKNWRLKKIEGSHHIYTKEGRRERISVPVHGNKDVKVGLLRIMKIAGIDEAEGNYSPDLPGCVATGATREDAERNMHEAIELHVRGLLEDNLPIPESSICKI